MGNSFNKPAVPIEALEHRLLLDGTPLNVMTEQVGSITQLGVYAGSTSDQITISKTRYGLKVTNTGGWERLVRGRYQRITVYGNRGSDRIQIATGVTIEAVVFGGPGNDSITGGMAGDRLYGGPGNDTLIGGDGDDVLVSTGDSGLDRLTGSGGTDAFWMDSLATDLALDPSTSETALDAVHQISNFFYSPTTQVSSVSSSSINLADPAADNNLTYKNFSTKPLFSSLGPSPDDVFQGNVGDCYYLAVLASVADVAPMRIKQSIVELGDGTYAVQFERAGSKVFVRVDADLPTWSWGSLAYAKFGKEDSLWVALMEKAFAAFRRSNFAYSDITGGWMSEAYDALGLQNDSIFNTTNGVTLLNQIKAKLDAGYSVTYAVGTPRSGAPVVGSHAYTVVRIETDAMGNPVMVLRNPWGTDGAGSDGANDGYVKLTATQAKDNSIGVDWAIV